MINTEPHATIQIRFQDCLSINISAGIFNNQLLNIKIFRDCLNAERYTNLRDGKLHEIQQDISINISLET